MKREGDIYMVKFKKGDMIVYGNSGVCEVKDTCAAPFANMNQGTLYYVLKPLGSRDGSMIYSPMNNQSVNMRNLMTREEAERFIDRIPSISPIIIENEKNRKLLYKQAMEMGIPEGNVSVIKTVYNRRKQLLNTRKRLPDVDSDYERMAKHCLYSELSVSLDIPYSDVEEYIISAVGEN